MYGAAYFLVMVGLGPTIHESPTVADRLVDGRAKHDHDGVWNAKTRSAQP
jgi:hypothetical protein